MVAFLINNPIDLDLSDEIDPVRWKGMHSSDLSHYYVIISHNTSVPMIGHLELAIGTCTSHASWAWLTKISPGSCPRLRTSPAIFSGLFFRCHEYAIKFEVRSFTRSWDNWGTETIGAVPGYAHAPFFTKIFNGLLFRWTCECSGHIWSP